MHQQRKSDHLRINVQEDVDYPHVTTGFERYQFVHNALPEIDLQEVDTSITLLGKLLAAPLIIASMTGGTRAARGVNRRLAEAAQTAGVAMGVGSQRAAIENPRLADTYRVRDVAPDILLMANLGAIQLNYGYGVDECQRAVEMIDADALILHLNPLHEALQPTGDTRFAGILPRIEAVCRSLDVPVIAKEVGFGISEQVARQLCDAGVSGIDVAGAGGTSWSRVEWHRATSERNRLVAAAFSDWGIPTSESLLMAQRGAPGIPVFASGGIRDGIQMGKAIALGAAACAIAGPFLRADNRSAATVAELIEALMTQLRVAMFSAGIQSIEELRGTALLRCGR